MTIVEKTILNRQNPVTGLFENNATDFPGLFSVFKIYLIYRSSEFLIVI